MKRFKINLVFAFLLSASIGCQSPPVPKQKGYFRISLPDIEFRLDTTSCGSRFELPVYSHIEAVKSDKSGKACWFNIRFSEFNARLYCTDVPVKNNLESLMNDAQELVFSHDMKASGISRIRVGGLETSENRTTGVLYHLEGPVATPIQFFVTDSTNNFLRGSLYFDQVINADSTAPITERLLSDIEQLISTISWD
ncbi:MAG: gliding motility lipoprotein GldD [Flavobacteriales bacterium]